MAGFCIIIGFDPKSPKGNFVLVFCRMRLIYLQLSLRSKYGLISYPSKNNKSPLGDLGVKEGLGVKKERGGKG